MERNDIATFCAACLFVVVIAKGFMLPPEYAAGSEGSLAFIMGFISLGLTVSVMWYILVWGMLKLNSDRNNVA